MHDQGSMLGRLGPIIAVTLAIGGAAARVDATGAVDVPHGNLSQFNWVALPEFGGKEAIIYRSSDGKRVAAAFHESGTPSFTYPFDEFLIVTSGSVTVHVHGGSTFTLRKGDVAYFREGMSVDFAFSNDFSDITSLVADHEVKWR
jgi:uncharacterized cupin superfamily protein